MKRIGCIKHESYDPQALEAIFQKLETACQLDQGHDYEMAIDQLKIIPRTSDIEKFNSFLEFVKPDSECLTIYTYYGASKQYDTYFFYFKGIPAYKTKNQSLSGTYNLDEFEREQKAKILKKIYCEKLEAENKELKVKLEESEQKFQEEQQHWEGIKNGKISSYGEIGSAVLASLLSNPNIQKMFPALAMLGNFGKPLQDSSLGNTPSESEASFTRKGEAEGTNNEEAPSDNLGTPLSETDQNYLQFIRHLSEKLDEQQLKILMNIVRSLTLNPQALRSTDKHVQNFLKCKPQT